MDIIEMKQMKMKIYEGRDEDDDEIKKMRRGRFKGRFNEDQEA